MDPGIAKHRSGSTGGTWLLLATGAVVVGYSAANQAFSNVFGFLQNTQRDLLIATALFSALYVTATRRWPAGLPREVLLFGLWLGWTLLGNPEDTITPLAPRGFWASFRHAAVVGLIFWTMTGTTRRHNGADALMKALLIGCVATSLLVLFQGGPMASYQPQRMGQTLVGNANKFGYVMFFGIVCCCYFLSRPGMKTVPKVALVGALLLLTYGNVQSASRKSWLGEVAFLILWGLFAFRRDFSKRPLQAFFALMVFGTALYFGGDYVMENTYLGTRLSLVSTTERAQRKERDRIEKYRVAPEMVARSPLVGVGLGMFPKESGTGRSAHSDYVAVVTESGVVGALLYFGCLVFLLWRIMYWVRRSEDVMALRQASVFGAATLSLLAMAFGRVNYFSLITWAFLGIGLGFVLRLEDQERKGGQRGRV